MIMPRTEHTFNKGDRSMTQGFVAQYAVEATRAVSGVYGLDSSSMVGLKETLVGEHEGKGVVVEFDPNKEDLVTITVFPVVYYGNVIPEIAWSIQERVKSDVEKFTGLVVESVNVHVKGVIAEGQKDSTR
jgi:uncharacterized alkaline shock family protein YloU